MTKVTKPLLASGSTTKKPASDGTNRGRNTILTKDRQKVIVEALASGCYIETAAEYAGISRQSIYGWLDRGRIERTRLEDFPDTKVTPSERIYLDFIDTVEKARAVAEVRALVHIQRAALKGSWQASAWYLERSAPSRWARKERHEVSVSEDARIRVNVGMGDLEAKVAQILIMRQSKKM